MSLSLELLLLYVGLQAEKDPEDYTEADYKVIKEYEEKCRVLQAERERYRKMLEIEFKRLENTIKVKM